MTSSFSKTTVVGACILAIVGSCDLGYGATVLYHKHYDHPGDVPHGFYGGGTAQHLEDMEAGGLRFGITADTGQIIPPGLLGIIDSVLTDGNPLDPPGYRGHSWFAPGGSVTFTFDQPHESVGLVWTEGEGVTSVEFFRGNTLLGTIGPLALADDSFSGTTDEDTFFGATDPLGITSIHVWNTLGGIEIDHIQFGDTPARLRALEVVQSIQDWNNSVPLVAGKKTYVRAYLEGVRSSDDGQPIKAILRGRRPDDSALLGPEYVEPTTEAWNTKSGDFKLKAHPAGADVRGDVSHSMNFVLPVEWRNGELELSLEPRDFRMVPEEPAEPGGIAGDGKVSVGLPR